MAKETYAYGYWGQLIRDHAKPGKDRSKSRVRKGKGRKPAVAG